MYGQSLNLYTRTWMFLWFTQVEIDWKDTRGKYFWFKSTPARHGWSSSCTQHWLFACALIPHQVTAKIVAAMNGHEAVLQIWKARLVISWTMRLFRALRLNSHGWSRWPTGSKAEDLALQSWACLDGKVTTDEKLCLSSGTGRWKLHHFHKIGIFQDCCCVKCWGCFSEKRTVVASLARRRFNRTDSVSDANFGYFCLLQVASIPLDFCNEMDPLAPRCSAVSSKKKGRQQPMEVAKSQMPFFMTLWWNICKTTKFPGVFVGPEVGKILSWECGGKDNSFSPFVRVVR